MKAFIELELLITLCITSIIAGITFGLAFSTYNKLSFERSARQLLTDIEYLRSLALNKRETLKMEFFSAYNYYRFEVDQSGFSNTNCSIERRFNDNFGFPDYFGITPVSYIDEDGNLVEGSINFGGGSSRLTFYPDGTPSSGGHIVLYSKKLNKGIAIIVKPVTGRARIGKVLTKFGK